MLLLARRNLFSERIRLVISVGGVALSVFLICVLLSLYRGWDERVGGFVQDSNIDIWVGTEGTNDFLSAASVIPLDGMELLESQSDIEAMSPMIVRPLAALAVKIDDGERIRETEVDLHLIGFDTETRIGGPLEVIEGKDTPDNGEVIIDEALRTRYDVDVGDVLEAGGSEWAVVGISRGGDFVASQTVFVRLEQAQNALKMPGFATFIGVRLREGYPADDFKLRLTQSDIGVVSFTRDEFAAATRERILGNVLPILSMILVLAFIVGFAVAGLTIYTATIEKSREFGILKAVGFKNMYLYRLVFEQSMVTGGIGFVIGAGLTVVFGPFASDLVPQFVTLVRWQDLVIVFVATVVMSAGAGLVPVGRLAGIDPTSVFKG